MDNLITAIIATALLAAVAVMSANYGSDAIQNWQAKMDAVRIVGDAKNIAEAWREYTRANNGNPFNSAASCDVSGLLSTYYLSGWPSPPSGAASTSATYHDIVLKDMGYQTGVISAKYPTDTIALSLKSPKVCLAIAALAGYSTASAKATTITGDISAATTRRPYDCVYVDSDSSGAPSQGDTMLFIYRVFDQNNFTLSTMPPC